MFVLGLHANLLNVNQLLRDEYVVFFSKEVYTIYDSFISNIINVHKENGLFLVDFNEKMMIDYEDVYKEFKDPEKHQCSKRTRKSAQDVCL